MWSVLKRYGMIFLLLGILCTAITSIWNITWDNGWFWMNQDAANAGVKSENLAQHKVLLEKKPLTKACESGRHLSSGKIDGQETLEEAMNMEQYPKATVTATGYTAGTESTGKDSDHSEYGITYSGIEVKRDLYSTIAADLDVYPVGTIMYIPDYGYGVVADKGSAINGDEIDLYYPTVNDVYEEWGKQDVEVYIVEMGDGSLSEKQFNALNENDAMQVYRDEFNEG